MTRDNLQREGVHPSSSILLQLDEDYDGDSSLSGSTIEDSLPAMVLPAMVEPETYLPAPDIEEEMVDGLESMIVSFPGIECFLGGPADDFMTTTEWRSVEHLLTVDLGLDMLLEDMLYEDEDGDGDQGISSAPPVENNVVQTLALEELRKENLEGSGSGTGCCSICKNEVVEEEVLNRLPCGHYFHKDCILRWLRMKNNCPLCRFEVPTTKQ